VDYIAEHLTPTGRAAVIVPGGIIFQSGKAYQALRKMLVEGYLYAVVSLPAGVFQPYSGVKTSILFMDKGLCSKLDSVLFVTVKNDGFDLGAQRRPVEGSDLPAALETIKEFRNHRAHREHREEKEKKTSVNSVSSVVNSLIVPKSKIAASGDYNLTGARYQDLTRRHTKSSEAHKGTEKWPMVRLGDVCTFEYGKSLPEKNRKKGPYPVMGSNGRTGFHNEYLIEGPAIIIGRKGSAGEIVWENMNCFPIDTTYYVKINKDKIDLKWLYYILKHLGLQRLKGGAGIPGLNRDDAYMQEIPFPPLPVQYEIVAKVEACQRIIDHARSLAEAWKPRIEVDPEWPVVKLGDIAELKYGYTASAQAKGSARFIRITDISEHGELLKDGAMFINESDDTKEYKLKKGDLLVARTGATYGKTMLFDGTINAVYASYLIRIRFNNNDVLPDYYWAFAQSNEYWKQAQSLMTGGGQQQFNGNAVKEIRLALPPLAVQQQIVAGIEEERKVVEGCRTLAERYEARIGRIIGKVWGEE
jgi:type I restriction enzyme M protein